MGERGDDHFFGVMGDEMSDIKLIQGDCLTELKKLDSESIDLVFTSPPYNKNGFRGRRDNSKGKGRWSGADISYGGYDDNRDENEYQVWQIDILNECYRIIKKTGSIFYNHKIRRAGGVASHPFEWIVKSRAKFYQQIIWDRMSGPDHNIGYLDPTTELIFWLTKDTPKCHKDKKWATEVWDIPPELNTKHPAPFPLKLCKIILLLSTDKGDKTLDPFCGSGTLGVACKELERDFVGIELNSEYIKMAEKRIFNTQGTLL